MTALNCIGELLTSPRKKRPSPRGHAVRQDDDVALALQFAGPVVYLLTGRCLYPIYLITSHTSQEDQTKHEITRFLEFYGELTVVIDAQHKCKLIDYVRQVGIDPVFTYSPTINTYREHVLKQALPDTMVGRRPARRLHPASHHGRQRSQGGGPLPARQYEGLCAAPHHRRAAQFGAASDRFCQSG